MAQIRSIVFLDPAWAHWHCNTLNFGGYNSPPRLYCGPHSMYINVRSTSIWTTSNQEIKTARPFPSGNWIRSLPGVLSAAREKWESRIRASSILVSKGSPIIVQQIVLSPRQIQRSPRGEDKLCESPLKNITQRWPLILRSKAAVAAPDKHIWNPGLVFWILEWLSEKKSISLN